jgi:hypothetical protein
MITRRGWIGLLLSLLGWRPTLPEHVDPAVAERPWNKFADWERDGVWSDFAAWEVWMNGKLTDFYPPGSIHHPEEFFDGMDTLDRIPLYCLMCELADRRPA